MQPMLRPDRFHTVRTERNRSLRPEAHQTPGDPLEHAGRDARVARHVEGMALHCSPNWMTATPRIALTQQLEVRSCGVDAIGGQTRLNAIDVLDVRNALPEHGMTALRAGGNGYTQIFQGGPDLFGVEHSGAGD